MLKYTQDDIATKILWSNLRKKPLKFKSYAKEYVVDLGGNQGLFGQQFKTKENKIVTIDINREILRTEEGRILDGVEPVQGNILYLPFKSNTFDVVLARAVLHHIHNQLEISMSEIKRVMKKNGILIIQEPCYYNPVAYLIRKAFPTPVHKEEEETFKPKFLEAKVKRYFVIKEKEYHFLLSYSMPHIVSRLPFCLKTIGRKILRILIKIDKSLLKCRTLQTFCGYIMLVCIKGNY